MARVDFKKTIYGQLAARSDLLALLGPVSASNRRLFSGWPQVAPQLSNAPGNPDEGWLVFYEEQAVILFDTTLEEMYYDFHVWVTRLTLAEDVVDILDDLYHYKLAGQNSFLAAGYNVLHSQRIHTLETFDEEVHLYRKICRYRFRTQKYPFRSGSNT